jgi:1,4-alpha-glucan branching enzyme
MNQLKALVDLCHLNGLAVLLDLIYNHAGGDFGDQSLYFFDRQPSQGGNKNSLYFTNTGHAGGLVFDYAKPEVRGFLIGNARFFLDEYRVDGFRYDQVSVIDHDGAPHGWSFCQHLTSKPSHAESKPAWCWSSATTACSASRVSSPADPSCARLSSTAVVAPTSRRCSKRPTSTTPISPWC